MTPTDIDALIERVKDLATACDLVRFASPSMPVLGPHNCKSVAEDLRALISLASPSPAQTETLECVNCGSREGIDSIKARGFLSCCPERKMRPPPSPAQWPEDVVERAIQAWVGPEYRAKPKREHYAKMRAVLDSAADAIFSKTAALATLPPPEDAWRPIETAPKSGQFYVTRPDGAQMVFSGEILAMTNARTPAHLNGNWTHWAPLLAPPGQSALAPYRGGA